MPDPIKMSKTLSYWLRHRPEEAGLLLDGAGWSNVDAVLAALAREGLGSDWETLVQLVEQSDKQRFELSPDAARIRARQGHSVKVEGDWQRSDPPDILYHGTAERVLTAISPKGSSRCGGTTSTSPPTAKPPSESARAGADQSCLPSTPPASPQPASPST